MSDPSTNGDAARKAEVETEYRRVKALMDRLARARANVTAIEKQRNEVMRRLVTDLGEPQAEVVRRTGYSPMIVSWAVNGKRKPRDGQRAASSA